LADLSLGVVVATGLTAIEAEGGGFLEVFDRPGFVAELGAQ
jgi:hypothetical protein